MPTAIDRSGTTISWLGFVRRPVTGFEAMFWSLLVAAGLRAFSFGTTGLDWDESFYVVVAWIWRHGGVPYANVWDIHPMGVPALFALGTWIVGDGLLAARLLALLAVAGTAALAWVFLDKHARSRPAGMLAALFYLAYMARPEGLAANTEIFNNFAVTAASFLLAGETLAASRGPRSAPVFAAASLLGIGLQFKYVIFPEAVTLCCAMLLWRWRSGTPLRRIAGLAALAIVGGLLPSVIATGYYWWAGALQPYLDATFRANIAYLDEPLRFGVVAARLRYGLVPIAGLLIWPAVLPILSRHREFGRRHGIVTLWLMLWLIAACVDVASPLKFWKHYFNALVPPLCLIAGFALVLLTRERAAGFVRAMAIGMTLTLLPAAVEIIGHIGDTRAIDRPNVPREIADRIKAGGTNGHDVYVVDYDPLVYAYAGAAPPSRFVLGIELSDFSASAGTDAAGEIGRILRGHPRWIVRADPSPYEFNSAVRRELDAALRAYDVESSWRESDYILPPFNVRLYRRKASSDGGF